MKSSFIGVLKQSPSSDTSHVLLRSSNHTGRHVYVLPSGLIDGHIVYNNPNIESSTDLQDNLDKITDLTNDVAALQTRVDNFEAGSVVKTVNGVVTGTTRGASGQEYVFTATTSIASYIAGLPELGIDATMSSFTPTENMILVMNVAEDLVEVVGTRNQFFRIYNQGDQVISAGWNQHSVTNIPFGIPLLAGVTYQLREFDSPIPEAAFTAPPSLGSSSYYDILLVKYNDSGVAQWIVRNGSASSEQIYPRISNNSSGQMVMVAEYSDPFSVYNSDGSLFGTLPLTRTREVAVVKYDTDGMALWAARITNNVSSSFAQGRDVFLNDDGSVIISGYSVQGVVTYDSNGAGSGGIIADNYIGWVIKYDTNGFEVWKAFVEGFGRSAYALSMNVNPTNGDIVLAGYTSGPATLYIHSSTNLNTPAFTISGFTSWIVKYDSDGIAQWATGLLGDSNDKPWGAAIDSATGDIVLTVYSRVTLWVFDSTITLGLTMVKPTGDFSQNVLIKYDSAGMVKWGLTLPGSQSRVTFDDNSNIYVCGSLDENIYNADGSVAFTTDLTATGGACLIKYNSVGEALWYTRVVSPNYDNNFADISFDSGSGILVAGKLSRSDSTGYDSTGASVFGITGSGSSETFMVSYTADGLYNWHTIVKGATTLPYYGVSSNGTDNVGVLPYRGVAVNVYNVAESYRWRVDSVSTLLLR